MTDPGLIHRFADPLPLDSSAARRWLGSKGVAVAEMTRMGLPVPPGFTLSTDLWRHFEQHGRLPEGLEEELRTHVGEIEQETGRKFGHPDEVLLLAVRSGGPSSMPGMLDTVLNVGINGRIARGLAQRHNNSRFGLDVRRRFIESYATAVLGVPRDAFDALLGRRDVPGLDDRELEALLAEYERLVLHEVGEAIDDDPWTQLLRSIEGALRSWRSVRAQKYREAHRIDDKEGTAVTIQAMVFGNLGPGSGAGVAFTRNPSTGERKMFGEWLPDAQGEDVVSGRRTPQPLTRAQVRRGFEDTSLETAMPEVHEELRVHCERLERTFGDVQDVELTIERGKLWILQTRSASRTAPAAARIAVEMVEEGMLSRPQALARVEPSSLRQLLTPRLPDPVSLAEQGLTPVARGLAASPGAATGRLVLDGDAASQWAGDDLILVRADTSAEDVEVMRLVNGILTAAGGLTSHAAVVARAMGKPCVAGATSLHVDYERRVVVARLAEGETRELAEGEVLTIDGARGLVYAAAVPVEPAPASPHVESVLAWADEARRVEVWAETSSERLARVGRSFGADGVAVMRPCSEPLAGLVEAAGDGKLLLQASGAALARALSTLRASDRVLVSLEEATRVRKAATERGIEVFVETTIAELEKGPPVATVDADGVVLRVDDEEAAGRLAELSLPAGGVLLRGEEATSPLALTALQGRDHAGTIVAPLDVPVARLCAAVAAARGIGPS